jgi:hypothetical protein
VRKEKEFNVPDGIIAHLTSECGGNVHDRHVVKVMFEKETEGDHRRSGAKNAADLEVGSSFSSAFRKVREDISHTRNNWVRHDFKERRIVPTHYTIRTHLGDPGGCHLKLWLVETLADGENWREVAREEDNEQLNGQFFYRHICGCGRREVPLHPAGEHRQEPLRE